MFTDRFIQDDNPKYEVQVLQTKPEYANEKLEKLQNDGWQIAGNIDLKDYSHNGGTFMFIPLKRELKK